MNITILNGSPKAKNSNSGFIADHFIERLTGHSVVQHQASKKSFTGQELDTIRASDALVLAFPLYIDAVPSHLFRLMRAIERQPASGNVPRVYALINCGFYEGEHGEVALEILRNWCLRAGFSWGQGMCLGAGEMIAATREVPVGDGPHTNLGCALDAISGAVQARAGGEDIFISPNFPRIGWQAAGTLMWMQSARKNKVSLRGIYERRILGLTAALLE